MVPRHSIVALCPLRSSSAGRYTLTAASSVLIKGGPFHGTAIRRYCAGFRGGHHARQSQFSFLAGKFLGSAVSDIEQTQGATVDFPVIADPELRVANLYGMIHPNASDRFSVRSVFVIDPKKKSR